MSIQTETLIFLATWAVLLLCYALNRYVVKSRFLRHSPNVHIPTADLRPDGAPGSFLTRSGTLIVFLANIAAFTLVISSAVLPFIEQRIWRMRIGFPLWVNILGGVLFALYSIWGLLVIIFNPNYIPCYKKPRGHFVIATEGPYAVVRHPRYASEILMNLALFLFTGLWIPLLGVIGWPAVYRQAQAEEQYLLMAAGEEYGEYRSQVGMFLPKFSGKRPSSQAKP